MTSELRNLEYYREAFLEIQKFMEVKEEGMEVQEETVYLKPSLNWSNDTKDFKFGYKFAKSFTFRALDENMCFSQHPDKWLPAPPSFSKKSILPL